MGYLSHILLALGSVVLAELGWSVGLDLPWAVLLLVPVPHLLARLARRQYLAGSFRRAERVSATLAWSPPFLQLVALQGFGWDRQVAQWSGAPLAEHAWPEPWLGLSLLPFVVFELLAIDARARSADSRPTEIARLRRFQVRMFLSGVVPLALYLALTGLVRVDPTLLAWVEEVALVQAGVATLVVAIFAFFLPAILRNTWDTRPLTEGPRRAVLDAVAARAGFRCKEMRVWQTGGLIANAAIVGFVPRHRVVLFTDALLQQLGLRELAAVFAHEIGHARRGHVFVFAAWTLAFLLAADVVLQGAATESTLVGAAIVAVLGSAWYFGFGYLSRRFELDADLVSHEITGDTDALVHALEQVGGAHARAESSWRHFSTAQRVLFLRALDEDPRVGQRLRAGLRRWSVIGVTALLLAAAAEVTTMTSTWSEDRLAVDLRLGRYEAALTRLEADEEEAAFVGVVGRAAQLASDGELTEAELDAAAFEVLEAGDAERALGWLELGARRGFELYVETWKQLAGERDDAEVLAELRRRLASAR